MQMPFYVVGRSLPPSAAHMLLPIYIHVHVHLYTNHIQDFFQEVSDGWGQNEHKKGGKSEGVVDGRG